MPGRAAAAECTVPGVVGSTAPPSHAHASAVHNGGHCEASDRTLPDAVRREIGEETGITALEPCCGGNPVHIDVHRIEARPAKGDPAHTHFDIRYLFRTRGPPR